MSAVNRSIASLPLVASGSKNMLSIGTHAHKTSQHVTRCSSIVPLFDKDNSKRLNNSIDQSRKPNISRGSIPTVDLGWGCRRTLVKHVYSYLVGHVYSYLVRHLCSYLVQDVYSYQGRFTGLYSYLVRHMYSYLVVHLACTRTW